MKSTLSSTVASSPPSESPTTESCFQEALPEAVEIECNRLKISLGEEIFASGVAGNWRIFQRAKGHRHGLDDALVAWCAAKSAPLATRALDLGTGVGSVGLGTLWQLPPVSSLIGIEAQKISFTLFEAAVRANNLSARVTTLFGDLRALALDERFELITGSPPYFPSGTGIIPSDSQKAHARFELRGHVGDYAATAARHLAPSGVFVFCFPSAQHERCVALVEQSGLAIETFQKVFPTPQKPPLFSLYTARHPDRVSRCVELPSLYVVDSAGDYSPEMRAIQAARGFGPDGTNLRSTKVR